MKPGLVIASLAAAALLLSGCGAGQSAGSGTASPSSSASGPSSSPTDSAASPASQSGSAGPAPTATGGAAAGPSSAAPAGPALCKAADLTPALDSKGGGAAGSVYLQLVLTNSGAQPCTLKGFAGVSLVADATGDPIGAPATRDDSTPQADVLLAPGQAGTATLRYTQAGNYPDCTRTPAAGFRVYPPDDKDSLFVAAPYDACSQPAINLLTIGAFAAK